MGQGARADVVGHLRGLEIIQERDDGRLQFIAGGGDGEKQPWLDMKRMERGVKNDI